MKGIWFNQIHSYADLNLVLSNPVIPPAQVKTNYVDIPGADGCADLTEAHGKVRYKNRECTFTFTVFPYDDFEQKKTEVSNLLNGHRCKIILDKDPEYYWEGRCAVNDYQSDKNLHKIVVGASVAPYKLKINPTNVIVSPGENKVVNMQNGRKSAIPTIKCEADTTIKFGDTTFNFGAGTHRDLDIELVEGSNQVTVTSTQPVEFTYQEGDL